MDADKILSTLSNLNFYADVRILSGTSSSYSSEDDRLTVVEGETNGIGVRVLCNGSFGYAWSTRISDFPKLLKKAEKLAKLNRGKSYLTEQKTEKKEVGNIYPFPSTEEKISFLKEAKKSALSQKVKNVSLTLRDSNIKKIFLSSEGSWIIQKASYIYFSVLAIAKDGIQIQRGIERASSRKGYNTLDFSAVAQNASESAERLLKSLPPPKGRFPVIMDPEMSGVFAHEAIGHASEGDSIVERESILANKLEKKIASEKVNIRDSPNFDGFGQYFYDDEGVKAEDVQIITNGILKNYLHSRESAAELKTKSNGHARAESYAFAPIVRMSNTFFARGNESKEDVFDVKNGIYVIGMKGGSVDIFSGEFMFAAKEGRLIKNGSEEAVLRDITISGNILETLLKVECVGKDFSVSPGFCGKMGQSVPVSDGGPHLRVSEMKVG